LISPNQRVSLTASQIVADAAGLFQYNLDQPVPANQAFQLANGQPFTQRLYGGSWRFQENRTSLPVHLYSNHQKYTQSPNLDHTGRLAGVALSRQMSPVLTGDLAVSYERDTYNASSIAQKTISGIAAVRWQLGQRFGLRFVYAHSTVTPNGYHENQ